MRKYPFEHVPMEQTENEKRDDVLVYTGDPLTEPVTIWGLATLELFAGSDGEDTDWHVKVTDVGPEGRSFRVTQGCLRAACRGHGGNSYLVNGPYTNYRAPGPVVKSRSIL